MARYAWKRLGEFTARGHDGREFTLVRRGKYRIGSSVVVDPKEEETILEERLFTLDRQEVKRIDKGLYKIVSSGLILKSHDPDAP